MRGDVLPTGRLQEIFLSVGDLEVSIGVELADVPGMEPPVCIDRLAGLVRLIVIAPHDVGALREDLAVRRDLDQHPGDRLAHGTELEALERVEGQHGRRLRQAVSLDDR